MLTRPLSTLIASRLKGASEVGSYCGTRFAVIDDLLPEHRANAIAAAYPATMEDFSLWNDFRERKHTSNAFDRLPALLGQIAYALQAAEVIAEVERLTGLSGLIPDPTSYAGGVTIMEQGDFLNPHIDNSHNGSKALYRRLNLLYYPNPDWRPGDGGELELWDQSITRPHLIEPRFNRLAIMQTDRKSWHSVAPILRGRRCAVSSYYFSQSSPDGSDYYHVTSFMGRPGQPVRRAVARLDNAARRFARRLGVRRPTDKGNAQCTTA